MRTSAISISKTIEVKISNKKLLNMNEYFKVNILTYSIDYQLISN